MIQTCFFLNLQTYMSRNETWVYLVESEVPRVKFKVKLCVFHNKKDANTKTARGSGLVRS